MASKCKHLALKECEADDGCMYVHGITVKPYCKTRTGKTRPRPRSSSHGPPARARPVTRAHPAPAPPHKAHAPEPAARTRPLRNRVFPSLHQLIHDKHPGVQEAAMEEAEAWPASRVNLLDIVNTELNRAMPRNKTLPTLSTVFNNLHRIGAQGVYGVTQTGCLKPRVDRNPTECAKYALGPRLAQVAVLLVIKSVARMDDFSGMKYPYSGMRKKQWEGNVNHIREILMGRFLNHLVKARITPHVPMVYEAFQVASDRNREYFTTELCHLSLKQFVKKDLAKMPADTQVKVVNICLLQLVHALACARRFYNFRHNDAHGDNAMMTFITSGSYDYKVGDKYYRVPNYGMCWKFIDFGYASSDVFGSTDVKDLYTHAYTIPYGFDIMIEWGDVTDMSLDFYDIMRLLVSLTFPRTCKKWLDRVYDAMRDISIRSGKANTLQMSRSIGRHAGASTDTALLDLFHFLAGEYAVNGADVDKHSDTFFSMDRKPYTASTRLSGYEADYFDIDAHGKLQRRH